MFTKTTFFIFIFFILCFVGVALIIINKVVYPNGRRSRGCEDISNVEMTTIKDSGAKPKNVKTNISDYFNTIPETAKKRFVDPRSIRKMDNGLIVFEDRKKIILSECPNCGAPLNAIYEECQYCGSKYKNIDHLIEIFGGDEY